MSNTKTSADVRAEYIAGLRMLADLLEQNPELVLPFNGYTGDFMVFVTSETDQKEKLAAWSRALPGCKTKNQAGRNGELFSVSARLRGLDVKVIADRDEVCERVVTGTREVTEEVPDPDAPKVTVTKVVEDIEWICRPLLADETAGSVAS